MLSVAVAVTPLMEIPMKLITALSLVVLLSLCAAIPASAGRSDGVTFESWPGWSDPSSKGDIQFADLRVGADTVQFANDSAVSDANIFLLDKGGNKFSGLGVDYPESGQTTSCSGVVEYQQDFTLAMSQSSYWNSSVKEKELVTSCDTGRVLFEGTLIGDSRLHLGAGKYNFLTTASAVPEPGSILALLTGIIGLAGFTLRRRA